jgi:hypothetical protein
MMPPMKIPECTTSGVPGFSMEYFRILMMKNRIFPYPSRHEGHPPRDHVTEWICECLFSPETASDGQTDELLQDSKATDPFFPD